MNRDRKKVEREIQQYENKRSDGIFSGIFGGRSEEQKEKDKKDIKKFRQK